jgi:hypothetical protein
MTDYLFTGYVFDDFSFVKLIHFLTFDILKKTGQMIAFLICSFIWYWIDYFCM